MSVPNSPDTGHDDDGLPEGERDIYAGFRQAEANASAPPPLDDEPPPHDGAPPGPPGGRDDAPDKPQPPCPVTPLGIGGDGRRYYVTPIGRVVGLADASHQGMQILGLFEGDARWLEEAFPRTDRKGNAIGWEIDPAAAWLMRRCAARGGFDPGLMMRGHGAWPPTATDPTDGLIVHCGDALLVDGKDRRPGPFGRRIYPARAPLPWPAAEPLTAAEGRLIEAHLRDRFAWEDAETMPRLLLGFLGAGYLPAALEARPPVHIGGERNTGKTTVLWFTAGMLGDWAVSTVDSTPAYIRQRVHGSAMAVMVDEIEGGELHLRAADIVKLARIAWSDKSGQSGRGSVAGTPDATSLDVMFMFASVIRPPMSGADLDRFTWLGTVNRGKPPPRWDDVDADSRALFALGPKLHRRMLDGWRQLRPLIGRIRGALLAKGVKGRAPTNLATLLACAELITGEKAELDQADIDAIVTPFDPRKLSDRAGDDPGWKLCLERLLTSPSPNWSGGEHKSIGRLVRDAMDGLGERQAELRDLGMTLYARKGEARKWFAIATRHTRLDGIFENTDWCRGGWAEALRQAPGAWRPEGPINFVSNQRAVCLPLDLLDIYDIPPPEGEAREESHGA